MTVDAELAKQGAILVEERVLRRVIKHDRKLRGVGLQVPHERCYALPKDRLAPHVEADELAVAMAELPERVVLVSADREKLSRPELANQLWRLLFHGKVHEAFDEQLASRKLTLSAIRERIHRIGQTEFDEIRTVLKQEDLLLPPVDDIATYTEFVALYLEIKHFAPAAIDRTFPALFDIAKVDATIALDVDAVALLAAARPPGAPEQPIVTVLKPEHVPEEERVVLPESAKKSAIKAAAKARDKGNRSRSAILHFRGGLDRNAETDITELVARLGKALALRDQPSPVDAATAARWVTALTPVAAFAAHQSSLRFSAGARLLYDLQAACVVNEREVKAIDFFGWAFSLGKRKIVRPLPATREVRIAKHLRAAVAKVPASGVPSEQLTDALREMAELASLNVRKAARPKLEKALDDVELHPHSLPEHVGEKKLVDELLDRAVTVGNLSLGNLRDGVSRNDLKIPDLSFDELKRGDVLLKTDKILATSLDGVYRRGEGYMRGLQKFSSLWFGTKLGRFLTLYLALPFLAALAVVDGIHHMFGPLVKLFTGVQPAIATWENRFVGVGFFFLLIHIGFFRHAVIWTLQKVWLLLKLVLWQLPRVVWRHPLVARALDSRFVRWLIRPAIPGGIAWLATPADYLVGPVPLDLLIGGSVYVVSALVMNSRFGRMMEERITDWAVRSGRHLTTRLVPGLVKWLLEVFVRLVEQFERVVYRVDEWLRFKSGQGRIVLVGKGVLVAIWAMITWLLRFVINLFVEPTVNPIKHFPVVTVAAKLIIPIIPAMADGMTDFLAPLVGKAFGAGIAGVVVILLPGLAGFLVWEFKENWRMYRANRPKAMRALAIGHHGESMVSFLKPGFHSGTIPKHYTKLRRAAWKDDERGVAKQREGLHHVEEAISKFVERQLVSMLNEVPSFKPTDVALVHVEIGSNRIQIELACPSVAPEKAVIRYELQSGWLVASIPDPGWVERLDAHHRTIFEIALSGFYKLSGVELVREQLEHSLRTGRSDLPPYDIADEGLVVWPADAYEIEVIYNLHKRKLDATRRGEPYEGPLPDFVGHHALFARESLYWSVWSTAWQQIARGDAPMPLLVGPSLLPQAQKRAAAKAS